MTTDGTAVRRPPSASPTLHLHWLVPRLSPLLLCSPPGCVPCARSSEPRDAASPQVIGGYLLVKWAENKYHHELLSHRD